MTKRSLVVGVLLLGALLVCAWWVLRPDAAEPEADPEMEASRPPGASVSASPGATSPPRVAGRRERATPAKPRAGRRRRPMTPAQHRARLAEILRRLQQATPEATGSQGAGATGGAGEQKKTRPLTARYLKSAIKEIVPLFKECYENALKNDPKLSGKLVVQFEIVGDPEVGGLVAHSKIDPKRSTIKAAGLNECVRESVYALELDAPEEGGKTQVSYPLRFSPKKPASKTKPPSPATR